MNPKSRLILIGLLLAAAAYFLWPTYRFYQLDGEREPYAHKVRAGRATPRDSLALARWDSLNGDAYRSAQAHRIKLGLDLRGGIYITMEVDVPTLLYESAQADAIDEPFEKVMDATRKEAAASDESVLDIFLRNFDKYARPAGKSLLNYYDVGSLSGSAADEEIVAKLRKNIDDAVGQAIEVVRRRIDQFGVSEVTITRQAGRRIVIELPGASDEGGVRSLLQTTARLEFKLVKNDVNTARFFARVDKLLAGKLTAADTATSVSAKSDTTKADTAKVAADTSAKLDTAKKVASDTAKKADSAKLASDTSKKAGDTSNPYAGMSKEAAGKAYQADHPFTTLFYSQFQASADSRPQEFGYMNEAQLPEGEYTFYVPKSTIVKVKRLLSRTDVKAIMPEDIVFSFSADVELPSQDGNDQNSMYGMYAVTRDAELTGEVITDAYPSFDQSNRPMVLMQMNADGADRWAAITGKNLKKRVAIVLDSAVYSAPVVQSKIPNGSSQITGSKDANEANLLAVVLKAGALKAPVRIIEERLVGPSLGEDSIRQGIQALMIAALLVVLFMGIYYVFGGIIADLAVVLNVLFTIAVLAAFQATLTLPGLGGLVLTIGMAVDANVLIYERIREEIERGRSLSSAVGLGYEKAFAAIIDSNITTFLTGAILYWFGTGPIQGFAVTLMIGIAATLFTAVFITRAVFEFMLQRGTSHMNFGQPKPAGYPELA